MTHSNIGSTYQCKCAFLAKRAKAPGVQHTVVLVGCVQGKPAVSVAQLPVPEAVPSKDSVAQATDALQDGGGVRGGEFSITDSNKVHGLSFPAAIVQTPNCPFQELNLQVL